ncbi:Aldehyde-alcohol dehydrogenase [Weissella viridescens]|uniref:Aldehyde-alcohol dehydrogenase n=1 Tax=Weissella viridescens TaxID=1629 RepID=A0A380NY77_WEIVI|nr:Aldehyde-alcohol dehydrogenase [Weissella viridescens]
MEGKDDAALVDALLAKIKELTDALDVDTTLTGNGVSKKAVEESVDRLSDLVYDDQTIGTNPRQPFLEEIKQLLLDEI